MRALFSSIADRYDRMNRVMSLALDRRWRRKVIADLDLPPRANVLDLACGTGDFTAALLQRLPDASVTCVDLTPEMLALARQKLAGASGVTFCTGDAQDLAAFTDATFDLVVCAFGFRNFPDKEKALAACHRVLKPAGRLVVLELFRPTSRLVGALVNIWLSLVAFLFASRARKAYAYLRRSVSETVSADAFVSLAARVGFRCDRRRTFFPSATGLSFRSADAHGVLLGSGIGSSQTLKRI